MKPVDIDTRARRDYRNLFVLFGVIIAGRIAQFLITIDRAQGFWGTACWLGVAVLAGIETALYFGFGLIIVTDMMSWRHTIRLSGFPRWSVVRDYHWVTTQMKAHPRNDPVGMLLFVGLFAGLGFTFSHRFTAVGLVCQGVMILRSYMQTLLPAAVLYLANSTREKISLQILMKRANPTIRVVALLDFEEVVVPGQTTDEWMAMMIENDCLRTSDHGIWKEVVTRLSRHVPLIVLDTRDATPGVVFEVGHLLREGLAFKTIYVVGSDGKAPALRHLADELGSSAPTVVVATEHTVSPLIRNLTLDRSLLPTVGRDLNAILEQKIGTPIGTLAAVLNLGEIADSPEDRAETAKSTPIQTDASVSSAVDDGPAIRQDAASLETASPRPRGATKCSACGYWKPEGEWVCPSCGHANRVRIGITGAAGLLFIVIGLVLRTGWWRWIWLALGGILTVMAINECVLALRVRRRKSLTIRATAILNAEQFAAHTALLAAFVKDDQDKDDRGRKSE